MSRIKISPLISTAIVVGLLVGTSKTCSAETRVLEQGSDIQTNSKLKVVSDKGMSLAQVNNGVAPQLLINQRAITIIGQGQVTAPADIARLELRFISRQTNEPPVAGLQLPSAEDEEYATQLAIKPVVDALVALDVAQEDIVVQTSSVENPKVLVNLKKPTRERIEEVITEVNKAVKANNQLFLQGIGAEYGVKNCQPLERVARRIALKDAQSQVKSFAVDLGVKAGDILFVTVFPSTGTPNTSACGTKAAVPLSPFALASETMPPYDPSVPPEVRVRSQVSVTYAIQ